MVDAGAAVDLAKRWETLPPMGDSISESTSPTVPIPDSASTGVATTVTQSLTVDASIGFIEFVEVKVSFQHDSFRDLEIELVSPSGAVSELTAPHDTYGDDDLSVDFVPLNGEFRFGSARHLGEAPNGEWKLRITDRFPAIDGTLNSWRIKVYGHETTPDLPILDWIVTGEGSLAVGWVAPLERGGPKITAYDLRYILDTSNAALDSNWTLVEDAWTGAGMLLHAITGPAPRCRIPCSGAGRQ